MNHPPDSSQPNPPSWLGHDSRRSRREHYMSEHRPAWWPENEDWPPHSRHQWRQLRRGNPFLRRLGCVFAVFNIFSLIFIAAVIGLILNAFGIVHFSVDQFQWLLPFGGVFFAIVIAMLILSALNLRRMSVPLDDLLDASNKVAEGDYSARVDERGPQVVRSLARGFNSMASRLQVNDQQRRAMLADVSHELRTPLTIIQGNIEAILDGVYPADETRLKSILEETQILSRLVEDLRTLSLAESGSLQLKRESTDIAALIRETASAFQSQADTAEVKINLFLNTITRSLEIDPERIRQVLTNLISNALRYSPRGSSIKIDLTESSSSGERRILISVPFSRKTASIHSQPAPTRLRSRRGQLRTAVRAKIRLWRTTRAAARTV